jgi:hypothetical protein
MVTIPMPTRPTGTSTTTGDAGAVIITPPDASDISDYQSAKKIVDYQVQHQPENRQKLFSLVWQQCAESMHAKIRAHRECQIIEQDLDGIELLRIIKLTYFNVEDEKYVPQKVPETKAAFYRQGLQPGMPDQVYECCPSN